MSDLDDNNLPRHPMLDADVQSERAGSRVIAFGSGKGGVGKSVIATSVALGLGRSNKRVTLLDGDLGGANLHSFLGVGFPELSLSDLLQRKVEHIDDVTTPTAYQGVSLVSGAFDTLSAVSPKYAQKIRLLRQIASTGADYTLLDLGSGTGFNVLDFFLIADVGMVTVIPEPTSVENAYRFVKALYYRCLKHLESSWEHKPLLRAAIEEKGQRGLRTPAELIADVERRDSTVGAELRRLLAGMRIGIIVSQAREEADYKLAASMAGVCTDYLGVDVFEAGTVPFDDAVWRAVRKRRPTLIDAPNSSFVDGCGKVQETMLGVLS
jgi:flagellar biosynthesis protein FlhG